MPGLSPKGPGFQVCYTEPVPVSILKEPLVAGKCDVCGKGPQFGHNVSHSKRRTNRMWQPNTHKATIVVKGAARRVNICTRCLRTAAKA